MQGSETSCASAEADVVKQNPVKIQLFGIAASGRPAFAVSALASIGMHSQPGCQAVLSVAAEAGNGSKHVAKGSIGSAWATALRALTTDVCTLRMRDTGQAGTPCPA